MVLANPNTALTTLSPAEQQAYAMVDACFIHMLAEMVRAGLHPERIVEPLAQKLAAMCATVKIRGGKLDIEDILSKLRAEYAASIKQVIGNGSLPS